MRVCRSVGGCVAVCEGVSQCVRVRPSVGGCLPVWEGVSQCGRVCLSEVCTHTAYMHACQVSVHVKADITHAALLTTRPFPTTLYM